MTKHNHEHGCGCGNHSHNHSHNHGHHHNCGCHTHDSHENCCGKHKQVSAKDISETEIHFLKHLLEYKFLPVAKFVVKSNKEPDFENTALSYIFIIDVKDSMEQVKNAGKKLRNLEGLGLITIDYDIPLNGYAYEEYHNSDIYAYFKKSVNDAKGNEGFLGDSAIIECGSIAPTEKCKEMLANNSSI